jgi:hypothetical protein
MLPRSFSVVSIFSIFSVLAAAVSASAATVVKVQRDRDVVIVKLSRGELERASPGSDVVLEAVGGDVDATVDEVSGQNAKLKVVFGIDRVSEGEKVRLRSADKGKAKSKDRVDADRDDSGSRDREAARGDKWKGRSSPFAPDVRAPWALQSPATGPLDSPHRAHTLLNPAQATRVTKLLADIAFEVVDGKFGEKSDDEKLTIDLDGQHFGLGVFGHVASGVRLGLEYGQEEYKLKSKYSATDATGTTTDFDGKVKMNRDVMTALVAAPVSDLVSLGAEYAQVTEKLKPDDGDSESVSYSIFRPGVVYHTRTLEAGFKYSPPIDVREGENGEETASDPRRLLLHAQLRSSPTGGSFGGSVEHVHAAGLDDDATDYCNVKAGGDTRQEWGSFGAFALFRSKSYRKKENAGPVSIPLVGVSLLSDLTIDQALAVGLGLTYARGEAKARTSFTSDDESKLEAQIVELGVSVRHAM